MGITGDPAERSEPLRVAWVGDDLLMRSRAMSGLPGVTVVTPPAPDDAVAAVFVDLNRDAPARIAAIESWRSGAPGAVVVAFCGHEEGEVRRQAMAAGASSVVTNGGLAAAARRALGRA